VRRERSADRDIRSARTWPGIAAMLAFLCHASVVYAQSKPHIPRVGFVAAAHSGGIAARVDAFRQGLKELGYVEGRNIIVEYQYAEEKIDRLPAIIGDLARLPVDVIVSAGPAVTQAARSATRSTPIVMAFDADPVGSGAVASLARPGGNVTGMSILATPLTGKQLELLKAVMPKLARVAVLERSDEPGNAEAMRATRQAAAALGVQLDVIDVRQPADIEPAFRTARRAGADAILVLSSPLALFHRVQIADLAASHRLPAIYPYAENVEAGGLMTYGVSINDLFRRSATFVDRILRGSSPAELPVEQPTKFHLVINLKAARRIGLDVPRQLVARADRVIE